MLRESKPQTTAPDPSSDQTSAGIISLPVDQAFAIAVSGGGDSLALMHMAAEQLPAAARSRTTILSVDHGLRPSAADEAAQVAVWANALGFRHATLRPEQLLQGSALQARAREVRYDLMCGWCRDHGVRRLLLAHTKDDQAETVGMRLLKSSGPNGLAGMAGEVPGPYGVTLMRPLLGVRRAVLRAWLAARGHEWFDDPGNDDLTFERVRMRRALAEGEGLALGLAHLASDAGGARDMMQQAAADLISDAALIDPAGWATIDAPVMASAPQAVRLFAWRVLLAAFGGATHLPSETPTAALLTRMAEPTFRGATLSGAHAARGKDGAIFVGRESRNLKTLALTRGQRAVWDNRFLVAAHEDLQIGPFAAGIADEAAEAWVRSSIPAPFRGSAPLLRGADRVIAPFGALAEGPLASIEFAGISRHLGREFPQDCEGRTKLA